MLITTGDIREEYEVLGLVKGSRVRSANVVRDLGASLKNVFGGELTSYTKLLNETRDATLQDMTSEAQKLGANAIINVRFSSAHITQGAAEILVYGTAVRRKSR